MSLFKFEIDDEDKSTLIIIAVILILLSGCYAGSKIIDKKLADEAASNPPCKCELFHQRRGISV